MKCIRSLFLLCIAVSFAACNNGNSKEAFAYSQQVVTREHTLMPDIQTTEQEMARYIQAGAFDSAKITADNMAEKVQATIDDVKQSPVPAGVKGGKAFKQASVSYFEHIKAIYTGYASLAASAANPAAYEQETMKLKELVLHKDQAVKDIYEAQLKFSKANNFTLQPQN